MTLLYFVAAVSDRRTYSNAIDAMKISPPEINATV
jgi:hypothetical protein